MVLIKLSELINTILYNIKKKTFFDFTVIFIGFFFNKILIIFVTSIVSNYLSLEARAEYIFLINIYSYFFIISNFGFDLLFIIKLNDKKDFHLLFSIQFYSRIIYSIFSIIFILIFAISFSNFNNLPLLLLIFSRLILTSLDLNWFLRFKKNFFTISLLEISSNITKLILIFILSYTNYLSILTLVLVDLGLDLISKLFVVLIYKPKFIKISIIETINTFINGFKINASNFLISIYNRFDQVLIGVFLPLSVLAIYNAAYSLLLLFYVPGLVLNQLFMPVLVKEKNNFLYLKRYFFSNLFFSIVSFFSMNFFGGLFIELIYGSQYLPSIILLFPLSITVPFFYLSNTFANTLNYWGYHNYYFKIVLFSGLFNFALNILFLSNFGIMVSIIATIGSEFIVFVLSLYRLSLIRKLNV